MKQKLLVLITLGFAVLTVASGGLVASKQKSDNFTSAESEVDKISSNVNPTLGETHYSVDEAIQIISQEFEKIADRYTEKTLGAIKEISNFTGGIKKTVDTLASFHGIKIDTINNGESSTARPSSRPSSRLTRRESLPKVKIDNSPCGADPSWIPYNREKCYKIFDSTQTFEAASEECIGLNPDASSKLLVIQSTEEQAFITSLLFTKSGIVDNVWINGILNPNDQKFYTTDNIELTTTYWANGAPTNISGRNCIQMTSTLPGSEAGKWIDAYCSVRNVFVCQKTQQFSLSQLQEMFFEEKRQIESMKRMELPLGFIYVQFPTQAPPKSLWPHFDWEDISLSFSGSFFRAFGNASAPFGSIQSESSPHLENVQPYMTGSSDGVKTGNVTLSKGSWTDPASSGRTGGSSYMGLKFYLGNSEVRPKNMAIKIWKRTG